MNYNNNNCLMHLSAHSTQAILVLQWMLDYEDVPEEHDACEYLWGSERINHPASSLKTTRSPTGFNGSQCVKELVFTLVFPLAREVFWVFTFMFSLYFPLSKRGFLRNFFFYVLRFFCIFFQSYLCEDWVFWKSRIYIELKSIRGWISPEGGKVLQLVGLITSIGS